MMHRSAAVFATLALGLSLGLAAAAQAADPAAGAKVYRKCLACHVVDKPTNKVGPSLQGVFGRTAGTLPGFKYSKAMKKAGADGLVWDETSIAAYLKKPRAYIKGTRMAFAGLKKTADIDNVIAYIKDKSQ